MAGDAVFFGADVGRRPLQDIREGVRRRLVTALGNLRRADQCLDDEPDRARELIRAALGYADIGRDEIRDPITDIYLGVLTAEGLAAAVSALAQLSTVPLTQDISPARCAQSVEAAAYFLIAETLTIVSAQSRASRVHVAAHTAGANLLVDVCCDVVVDADTTLAARLAGLRLRVEAFDGTLEILNQPGIGTRLRATFPYANDPPLL